MILFLSFFTIFFSIFHKKKALKKTEEAIVNGQSRDTDNPETQTIQRHRQSRDTDNPETQTIQRHRQSRDTDNIWCKTLNKNKQSNKQIIKKQDKAKTKTKAKKSNK
jgi:hypothetical protein